METRGYLEQLLNCDIDFPSYDYYIWGTGNTSDLYQEGLKRLEAEGIEIKGYFDNDPAKWGKDYFGKPVFSPKDAEKLNNVLMLVSTPRPQVIREIGNQLSVKGITWLSIDAFTVLTHKKEILEVYDLLSDNKSKKVFAELVKDRIEGSYPDEEYIDGFDRYFYGPVGDCSANEVFVDCGAFVGDSFEQYLWKKEGTFKQAILLEPDADNLKALKFRLSRLKNEWNITDDKVDIYPCGVSDKDSIGYINRFDVNNGLGSKLLLERLDESDECKTMTIDSLGLDKNAFIKADIESYEYRLLLGAKETITRFSPKLAICIYHNSVDFYSIPLLLRSLNSSYKFSLRHYSPNLSETILYAYK